MDVFVKFLVSAIFYNYHIIFLLKILWNWSTVVGPWVHGHSLNGCRRRLDQWLRLKTRRGFSDLISVVDQGVGDWGGAGEVAARLEHGSGSLEPGLARATWHCFWWGFTLRTCCIEGNSPRGSSSGAGGGVGCVTVASLLQLWPAMRRSASQSPASRMGQASRRSPLAPWRFNCSKRQ
jgi:hypothetical protein